MPHYWAEILTIFCSYFALNDEFLNSFRNLLTFSIVISCYEYKTGGLKWLVNLQIQWPGNYYIGRIGLNAFSVIILGSIPQKCFCPEPHGSSDSLTYDGYLFKRFFLLPNCGSTVHNGFCQSCPTPTKSRIHMYLENLQNVFV